MNPQDRESVSAPEQAPPDPNPQIPDPAETASPEAPPSPEDSPSSQPPQAVEPPPAAPPAEPAPAPDAAPPPPAEVSAAAIDAATPPAEVPAAATEGEVSDEEFDALLEQYDQAGERDTGDLVLATVVSLLEDSVLVDLGDKTEGVVPIEEFKDGAGNVSVQVGDKVDVLILKRDSDGQVTASRKKAIVQAALAALEAALAGDDPMTGKVARTVKNGVIVDLGIECFMPASHLDLRRVGDLDSWVGREVDVMVLELHRGRRRAVVSRRTWLERRQREEREKFFAANTEGDTVTGRVKNITDFGMFLDLGGFDGLVPRDELSWERGVSPADVCSVGQEVTCQILKANPETGKITLSRKRLAPDPWEVAGEKYHKDDVVEGVVVNIADYGAFVRVEEGLTGLIHASDLSWATRRKRPGDFVTEGDHIKAQVLEIDPSKRRLSLGLKQIQPDPWAEIEREFPPGTKVTGKVTSVTGFGIFVQIRPDVEGLIHQSDLSWDRRSLDPKTVAKDGEDVEAVVLKVDRVNRKISLGHKQLSDSPYVSWAKENRVGTHVTGKVTRIVSFGAFVELAPSVEGLIHISHLSNERVERVEDVIKAGEEVTVKVLKVDPRNEKLNLSRRGYMRDVERKEIEQYTKKSGDTHGGANLGELLRAAGMKVAEGSEEPEQKPEEKPQEKPQEKPKKAKAPAAEESKPEPASAPVASEEIPPEGPTPAPAEGEAATTEEANADQAENAASESGAVTEPDASGEESKPGS